MIVPYETPQSPANTGTSGPRLFIRLRHRLFADDRTYYRARQWHFIYADGNVRCQACGRPYYQHPTLKRAHWLTRPCVGPLVKL